MLGRFWDPIRRRLFGDPSQLQRRIMLVVFVLSLGLSFAGLLALARLNVPTGTSSLPYLRPILEVVTSVWFYVVLLVFMLRRVLFRLSDQYARQAAAITGYDVETIKQERYETSSADGATRVLVTDEDGLEEIEERTDDALRTGEDDTISLNPDAVGLPDEGDVDEEPASQGFPDRNRELLARGIRSLVPTKRSLAGVAILLAALFVWHIAVTYGPTYATIGLTRGELELARSPFAYLAVAGVVVAGYWLLNGSRSFDGDADDDWLAEYKLARLDLATTLDFEEIMWSLLVPAALTVGLLLLIVQIWVPPWFYPPIFATGLIIGILNYTRVNWIRSRRLSSLRRDDEIVEFAELSVLVKEVALPERTTYVAFLAERRYAHDDREEFIEGVASRAYEVVNGVPVSPSVMEKQAEQLEGMRPDLHGFRENEKHRIMTWLLDRVERSRHGLVPKQALIEECIEHDLTVRGVGPLAREFGKGHDPKLVRDAYRELVPVALVEEEISLEDEEGSIKSVRLRTDPLPPEYGEIRAQFSSQFGGYADGDPMYRLPDVADKLDEAPIYARAAEGAGA